uniref:SJCHGC09558 protein n=1 Tax=Schistosoma japonicum TaxID=6182 RepID=Q5DGE9_SCHJA|nr:SJCHGC09558 protein [Schistosoma japonicum]
MHTFISYTLIHNASYTSRTQCTFQPEVDCSNPQPVRWYTMNTFRLSVSLKAYSSCLNGLQLRIEKVLLVCITMTSLCMCIFCLFNQKYIVCSDPGLCYSNLISRSCC